MRVISSRWTFFYKRIFPLFWFGFLAFFVANVLWLGPREHHFDPLFLIGPLVMAVFGFFLMRSLIFDLADEVLDAGNALIVRKGSDEVRVPLADIVNVDSSPLVNPPRITLTLRASGRLGRKIAFSPPPSRKIFAPFAPNATAEELIDRVDRARRETGIDRR